MKEAGVNGGPSRVEVRVRYAETDRMGVAYHGSFLPWFEIGRTDLLRQAGATYREMEEQGLFLPVVEVSCRYLRPARYDDLLRVETRLRDLSRVRMVFDYRLFRTPDLELLATATTSHAVVDATGRPVRLPERFRDLLRVASGCSGGASGSFPPGSEVHR